MHIIADIISLIQYIEVLKNKTEHNRLEECLCCGKANPRRHGSYPRKADHSNPGDASLNPIVVQRFLCLDCGKTCSELPECIPPRRWYLWEIQQIALALQLAGKSVRTIAQKIIPSRRTVSRWINRFKEQWLLHKDIFCNYFIDLGRTSSFADFWEVYFSQFSLAQAMRFCHTSGVPIP